jgi:3-oxoadipate enol-lactonase
MPVETLQINGSEFTYERKGSGQPLILVHGTVFNSEIWNQVHDLLAEEFTVIKYDRRGYFRNKNIKPSSACYGEEQGRDILAIINTLGLKDVIILGWSSGGFYALHAALLDASVISKLILYEPPYMSSKDFDFGAISVFIKLKFFAAIGNKKKAATVFSAFVKTDGLGNDISPKLLHPFIDDYQITMHEINQGTGEELTKDKLAALSVPMEIIVGENTQKYLKRASIRLTGNLPGSEIKIVKSCGHFAHVESPEGFIQAIGR